MSLINLSPLEPPCETPRQVLRNGMDPGWPPALASWPFTLREAHRRGWLQATGGQWAQLQPVVGRLKRHPMCLFKAA